MFHRYVIHNGEKIDYDRASWLMDRDTFEKTMKRLPEALGIDEFDIETAKRMGCPTASAKTPAEELQTLWNLYCEEHQSKFNKRFDPDVM